MKKLKYLLFILLFIPCMVKADMGAPALKTYEMVVTSPDGIDYYESSVDSTPDGKLNKNQKFTVIYEYDGVYTVQLSEDKQYTLKSLDGAVLIKDIVDPTKDKDEYIKELKKEKEIVINTEDGADMLEGPASVYKKVGYIPNETKLTYKYYISDSDQEDFGTSYVYVEYKGKKGWIDVLNEKVLFAYEKDYITMEDFKIKGITIPKNTVVRANYYTDSWSHKSLISYKGYEDYIDNYDETSKIIGIYKFNATAKRDFKVTTEANGRGVELITIPENARFIEMASYAPRMETKSQMYVEYQGKRGWIILDDREEVETDDQELPNAGILETDEKKEEPAEPVKDVAPVPNKKETKKKKTTKKSATDYTLTYVIIGASVAVIALVTIILVNKKSKKKKEAVKEEISVEQPIVKEEQPVVETPNIEENQTIEDIQKTEIEDTTEKTE